MNAPVEVVPALRDIHLPAAPGAWPPAPGWWLLAVLLLGLAAWYAPRLRHRLALRRQRGRLLRLLERLERDSGGRRDPERLAEVSRLLRRVALLNYPRREIASLSGAAWLAFLDRSGGGGDFVDGPGRVLADGPYVRELGETVNWPALIGLVRAWVERHQGSRPGGWRRGA